MILFTNNCNWHAEEKHELWRNLGESERYAEAAEEAEEELCYYLIIGVFPSLD